MSVYIADSAVIHPTAVLAVEDLTIGPGTIIRAHAELYGRRVRLGRECFIDEHAVIGGGSADAGELTAGDWLHMGMFSQVNTARKVEIGDEVGLGIGTRVFTHGAYLSEYDGFPCSFAPVRIGSRVWLPNALVIPGTTICDDTVVAAGAVCSGLMSTGFWAGAPATRKRGGPPEPPPPSERKRLLEAICHEAGIVTAVVTERFITLGSALFDIAERLIVGRVTEESERLRNQLRRHGIRFRYEPRGDAYAPWETA